MAALVDASSDAVQASKLLAASAKATATTAQAMRRARLKRTEVGNATQQLKQAEQALKDVRSGMLKPEDESGAAATLAHVSSIACSYDLASGLTESTMRHSIVRQNVECLAECGITVTCKT
jgi:hypothetical protein